MKTCCRCKVSMSLELFFKGDSYCKVCRKEKSAANYAANRDARRAKHAEYSKANAEKKRKTASEWAKANREKRAAIWASYYTSKLRAMPSWASREEIEKVYQEARVMTLQTGVQHHVDHIVPLQGSNVSGLHVHWNLQVLTALDNAKKKNTFECA